MRVALVSVVVGWGSACGSCTPAPAPAIIPTPAAPLVATPVDPATPPAPDDELHRTAPSSSLQLPVVLPGGPVAVLQRGHTDDFGSIAFDATGRLLASVDGARLVIWDITAREVRARFERPVTQPHTVLFSPDVAYAAVAGDFSARIVDLARGTMAPPIPCRSHTVPGRPTLAWTPDAHTLVMTCYRTVRVWDASGTTERYALGKDDDPDQGGADAMLSPDGSQLAFVGATSVQIRAVGGGKPHVTLAAPESVAAVAWSPDGKTLAIAGEAGVQTYDATTGVRGPALAVKDPTALAFAVDGRRLVVVHDNKVFAWTLANGSEEIVRDGSALNVRWPAPNLIVADEIALRGPSWQEAGRFPCQGGCGDIATAWSKDAALAAQRHDNVVRVWDVATGAEHDLLPPGSYNTRTIRRDGDRLVVGGSGGAMLDLRTGAVGVPPEDLLWSPDRKRAVRGATAKTSEIVDASGRVLARGALGAKSDDRVDWSDDSNSVFVLHESGATAVVRSWRARDLAPLRSLSFASDRAHVVVVPLEGSRVEVEPAHVIADLVAGTTLNLEVPPGQEFGPVAVSPTRKRFARGGRVYEMAGLAKVIDLPQSVLGFRPGHDDQVLIPEFNHSELRDLADGHIIARYQDIDFHNFAFSDDGNRLLIDTPYGIELWDVEHGTRMLQLEWPIGNVVGNRCIERDYAGLHITHIDTGVTLDIDNVDDTPTGFVAVRNDGPWQAGPSGIASVRIRPSPSVRDGALTAPTRAPVKVLDMVAAFFAECR